jgi:PKD repeat protein
MFNDTSTNTPTTWHWIMTPGGWDSHLQNFTHAFDAVGVYTVNLTVSNAFGSDTESKVDYITVANCTAVPSDCVFTNMSGVTLDPGATGWNATSGGTTWGMLITNATAGNVSYFRCGSSYVSVAGGSGQPGVDVPISPLIPIIGIACMVLWYRKK